MANPRVMAVLRVILTVAVLSCNSYGKPVQKTNPRRLVKGGTLISSEFPNIRIKPAKSFRYIGSFDFTVPGMARGERYVFAESKGHRIKKLFIAQFEEILPESVETYNYSFKDALSLEGHKFRQNTFAFSNLNGKQENPNNEGVLTAEFLMRKGYLLDDGLMASRFVTVPDAERKHELILFYLENVRDSGHQLKEFYQGEERTAIWEEISRGLTNRSFDSFTILN